jgi:hypothetical protein
MTNYASVADAVAALGELDLSFPAPLSIMLERSATDYQRWVVVIHTTESTFEQWIGASRLNQVETSSHDPKYLKRSVFVADGIKVFCLVEKDVQKIYSEHLTELEKADSSDQPYAVKVPAADAGEVDLVGALGDAVNRAKAARS